MKILNKIPFGLIAFVLFCSAMLFLSVRGLPGNPTQDQVNTPSWKEAGPFELSPERGRFALMYSVTENHSVTFSLPLARFTTPDVGYHEGNYVSLFAPALSYAVIPGYLIGKYFNASQVGAFGFISFFAVLNAILVFLISRKLGAHKIPSYLAAFTFLFASPAYAYAVNLYQHHVSTFLILLSIYLLSRGKNFFTLFIVFFLCAFSLPLDYPNLFLMLPIGLYALSGIISFKKMSEKVTASFYFMRIFAILAVILPIAFFLWFNTMSYGGPFNFLGGSAITTVKDIDTNGKPLNTVSVVKDIATTSKNNAATNQSGLNLFKSRNLVNGLYIHTLSPDRGIMWYTPVMLFGIIGAVILYKKKHPMINVLLGVIAMNILLYSMWGDPWGGWAFGSRYLIPSYSILSIFIAFFLTALRKKYFLIIVFFIVLCYSVMVNTLGAITSSRNPPQVEVLNLEKLSGIQQKYTYERNIDYLNVQGTKSFAWNLFGKDYVTAVTYYWILVMLLVTASGTMIAIEAVRKERV